jgi:MarR family transcriptional regulator, lower aerobic nicotinate degradation pathway regulator
MHTIYLVLSAGTMARQKDGAGAAFDALRRIVRYLRVSDREVQIACGLSVAQLFVLIQVGETPALSMADLADRTLTDQSSVSTVVARLVDRGYLARKQSAGDRRRAELRLTAAGKRVVRSAPPVPQVAIISAIRALPAVRRAELVRSLESLASAIGADALPPRMLFEDERPRGKRRRA